MGPAALPEVSFSDAVTCGQLAWASCSISTLLCPTKGTKKDEATSVRPHGRQTTLGSTQAKSQSPDSAKPLKNTHNMAAGDHLQRPGVPGRPARPGRPSVSLLATRLGSTRPQVVRPPCPGPRPGSPQHVCAIGRSAVSPRLKPRAKPTLPQPDPPTAPRMLALAHVPPCFCDGDPKQTRARAQLMAAQPLRDPHGPTVEPTPRRKERLAALAPLNPPPD